MMISMSLDLVHVGQSVESMMLRRVLCNRAVLYAVFCDDVGQSIASTDAKHVAFGSKVV